MGMFSLSLISSHPYLEVNMRFSVLKLLRNNSPGLLT